MRSKVKQNVWIHAPDHTILISTYILYYLSHSFMFSLTSFLFHQFFLLLLLLLLFFLVVADCAQPFQPQWKQRTNETRFDYTHQVIFTCVKKIKRSHVRENRKKLKSRWRRLKRSGKREKQWKIINKWQYVLDWIKEIK